MTKAFPFFFFNFFPSSLNSEDLLFGEFLYNYLTHAHTRTTVPRNLRDAFFLVSLRPLGSQSAHYLLINSRNFP